MSDARHTNDDAVFAELAVRYFDGVADAEEVARLTQMLEGNQERREQFVWLSYQSALLAHHGQSEPEVKDSPTIVGNESPRAAENPRWTAALVASVALAAVVLVGCVLVALGVWRMWPGGPVQPIAGDDSKPPVLEEDPPLPERVDVPVKPPDVCLVRQWRITPTGDAEFLVDDPMLVRLDRGELLVESTANETDGDAEALHIETPSGKVVAKGTRFYVGSHKPTERGESAMFAPLTRVLVLSGVVTLSTAIGSLDGTAGDLLAAEADKAPTKLVVQANSDFAFDLYKQLAKENSGKNLFFSPYSVSGALAMTAEGAREETAVEMGKVLRFPDAAKRIGDDAQLIPWETSLIHTGMSELNRKLDGAGGDPAKTAEIRAKITELRKELEAVKADLVQLRADRKWDEWRAAHKKEQGVAAKLNAEASQGRSVRNPRGQRLVGREDLSLRSELHQDDQPALRHRRSLPGRFQE